MALSNENNPNLSVLVLGSLTADTSTKLPGMYFPKKSVIKSVTLINGATIAASDTDYAQVALYNGADVVAELDTRAAHEDGVTANVGKALNVVEAESVVDAGTTVLLDYQETGTMALTSAVLVVEHYPL